MNAPSDAELLERWRNGDTAAGDELVGRHFVGVYRFFAAQVKGDLDDLTQRTFEACIAGRDRIRDDAAFRGYLYGIARRQLADHIGELQGRRARVPLSQAELQRVQSSPSRAFVRADQQRLLLEAVAGLPDGVRPAVEMFYLESQSVQAIARTLGIPVGTVKSRLFRGRTLLREAFERMDASPPLRDSTLAALEVASVALDDDA